MGSTLPTLGLHRGTNHKETIMSLSVVGGFEKQVKKLFRKKDIKTENFIFNLHSQFNFLIILVGILFITTMNYFNSNAITCLDDNSYVKNYCFLHGTSHIPAALQSKLSPDGSRCTAENYLKEPEKGERTTNYYIWLPFVLTICAIITKLPSLFWKNFFESGHMEKITNDCQAEKSDGAKIKKVLMESSLQINMYNINFAVSELLNFFALAINWMIINSLLGGKFGDYGTKAREYLTFTYDKELVDDLGPHNPMCNVFPTEVSCSVASGAATGGVNLDNTLCLLSNNVFNQYYFLIVWWWWVALFAVSALGLVYRVAQLAIPSLGRVRLVMAINKLPINEDTKRQLKDSQLNSRQVFFLSRLVDSLSTTQVERLLEDMHLDHVSSYPVNADKLTVVVD